MNNQMVQKLADILWTNYAFFDDSAEKEITSTGFVITQDRNAVIFNMDGDEDWTFVDDYGSNKKVYRGNGFDKFLRKLLTIKIMGTNGSKLKFDDDFVALYNKVNTQSTEADILCSILSGHMPQNNTPYWQDLLNLTGGIRCKYYDCDIINDKRLQFTWVAMEYYKDASLAYFKKLFKAAVMQIIDSYVPENIITPITIDVNVYDRDGNRDDNFSIRV